MWSLLLIETTKLEVIIQIGYKFAFLFHYKGHGFNLSTVFMVLSFCVQQGWKCGQTYSSKCYVRPLWRFHVR